MKFELSIAFGRKIVKMNVTRIDAGTFRIEGRDRIVLISVRQSHGWTKKEWVLTHGRMSQESVSIIGRAIEEGGNFD